MGPTHRWCSTASRVCALGVGLGAASPDMASGPALTALRLRGSGPLAALGAASTDRRWASVFPCGSIPHGFGRESSWLSGPFFG